LTEPSPAFQPRRFRTTTPYYAKYRLAYPDGLIARALTLAGLAPGDPVLDLGCGPGLLAVPIARLGMRVTAVDPEPEMLAAAGEAAREAGVEIAFREGSSFAMPRDLGQFKLIAMGRAFHWMDGGATLELLDGYVVPGGALAFFDDEHPRTAENAWWRALRGVSEDYGRNLSPHLVAANSPGYRTHDSLLLDSPFCCLEGVSVVVRRERTVDDIVGLAFSMSTSSRQRLDERAASFESDLRKRLLALSPSGQFVEIAELSALVASRP
jgi:SAM-dependent methyltransferase